MPKLSTAARAGVRKPPHLQKCRLLRDQARAAADPNGVFSKRTKTIPHMPQRRLCIDGASPVILSASRGTRGYFLR